MHRLAFERLIDRVGAELVVERVAPFLTPERRERIEAIVPARVASLMLAVEQPSDPHNAAAIVRTAEALGLMEVGVIAADPEVLKAQRTTQGAFHWLRIDHWDGIDACVAELRARSFRLVGTCGRAERTLADLDVAGPIALLLGNEHRGLSETARSACDELVAVPMLGMSESLNLSVTAAICTHEILRRKRAALGRLGDLDEPERARERARCCLRSADERLIRALFGDA